MISLLSLAGIAAAHGAELARPSRPFVLGDRTIEADRPAAVMGAINLSRDSTYRASVATSVESAVRRGRAMAAQGAQVVDVGAESSTAAAARVPAADQIALLVPVIEQLVAAQATVSAETYRPEVARAALKAGATVVNFTGNADEEAIFDLVAEHGATIVLCYVQGADVRAVSDADLGADPVPQMLDHFGHRAQRARARGVTGVVIDPGVGFYYRNLVDPMTRLQYQTRVMLNSFRLRELGHPVCQALPHALELFEDQYRTAEAFFAVLAHLGGVDVVRTHEVPGVLAVLRSMGELAP